MPLRIKSWQRVFENNRTRELDAPRYVCWPTKQDSEGFCELARTAAGTVALGVFGVLVQWASRAPVRGVLADERGEMNAERYAKRYGLPVEDSQVAFATLVAVGWLETADEVTTDCRPAADAVPVECRPAADPSPKERSGAERTGVERNGLERSGRRTHSDAKPKRTPHEDGSIALGLPSDRPSDPPPAAVEAVRNADTVRAALEALHIDGAALTGLAAATSLTLDVLRETVEEITKQPGVRNPKRLLVSVLCERHGVKIEKGAKYRVGPNVSGVLAQFEAIKRSKFGGGA